MSGLTNAEKAHLLRAVTVARTSTMRFRHGAVAAMGRRVLTVGVNSSRNHPLNVSNPKTEASIHAEIAALKQVSDIDGRLVLYVARVNRQGDPVLSEPCDYCKRALREMGVQRVIFTIEGGYGVWES